MMGGSLDRLPVEAALAKARDTRTVVAERGALAAVDRVFAAHFGDHAARVVADARTFAAAGQAVVEHLRRAGRAVHEPLVFPGAPALHADDRHLLTLEAELGRSDAVPLAVGAGTINDLTKLAAHRLGRPYMVVATAASMDGYAAWGAAITRDGVKQTFACPAPRAVLADLDVLAAAPRELTASGYGDLAGKVTAGADWLIADALGVEPVDPAIWAMVQPPLRAMLARPERLAAGDPDAVARLFAGLIITGLAMQASGSSRPASGSEHQFSHLWEMQGLSHEGQEVSHGFKVGVGSLAATGLYESLLRRRLDDFDVADICADWPAFAEVERLVRRTFANPALAERAVAEMRAKHPTPDQLATRLRLIRERWPRLRIALRRHLLPAAELQRLLVAAGCPTDPAEIGLTRADLRESYATARLIRRRYTVLDLAAETATFASGVDELFQPNGYWSAIANGSRASRAGAATRERGGTTAR
jgi:glycerol-1-phosphate dehydrogenase [NAD(P)+]